MTTSTQAGPQAPVPEPEPMRPAVRTSWAPVPQVNLLPPEILAKRRFRRLQTQLAGAGVAVVALCAATVVWAQAGVSSAETDLAAVRAQGALLQAQQAKYAQVPKALAELDRVKAAREATLGTDVAWYRFLSDLAINTPSGTQLSSVTITMSGKNATTAASAPLTPTGLGQVKVTGQALRFTDVAAWLDAVNKVHGLTGSGLDSATKPAAGSPGTSGSASPAASTVTFSGSAVVVPGALSHRYDRKAS
jgi:Tfp pilus assembly protein PilN